MNVPHPIACPRHWLTWAMTLYRLYRRRPACQMKRCSHWQFESGEFSSLWIRTLASWSSSVDCIIRFVGVKVCDMVAAIGDLIRQHAGSMQDGVLIVVTSNRVRVRRGLPPSKA